MKTPDFALTVNNLAAKFMWQAIMTDKPARVVDKDLFGDGRTRKKLWKQLLDQGYVDQADHPFGAGNITSHALDMTLAAPVDLAAMYKFDSYNTGEDRAWIRWNDLTVGQKKTIWSELASQGIRFFLIKNQRSGCEVERTEFSFGTGSAAMTAADRWDSFVAITSPAILAKHRALFREKVIRHYEDQALTWYLQEKSLLPDGVEKVPVRSKEPTLSFHAALPYQIDQWEAGIAGAIQQAEKEIAKATERLVALKAVQVAAEKAGGFEAFVADYKRAVAEYVDAHFEECSK